MKIAWGLMRERISFFLSLAITLSSFQGNAYALPFKNDCRSMARYVQAVVDENREDGVSYKFQGFSGKPQKREGYRDIYCEDGFITEVSPKGRLVCDGFISYDESTMYIWFKQGRFSDEIEKIESMRRMNEANNPISRDFVRAFNRYKEDLESLERKATSCVWR